jgi:dTDP-4-amino-4,6-dideoxygalactose transaminase
VSPKTRRPRPPERPEPSIPFNRPFVTGNEVRYIEEAITNMRLAGAGPFTRRCQAELERMTGRRRALLTHSATGALEMAALLLGIEPGDEVVMPSFTFVSTANAFVLQGAVPVFVDVRSDTLNLDERRIEEAITPRTRAVVPVHYAGVGCEMGPILEIAERHDLTVVEDAAQGLLSRYEDRPLGAFGACAALSFHETKNIISGEGGALLLDDEAWIERAEILWEKGTDRSRFFRGETDKYTWVDLGSSFLMSDLAAAFLWAQLEQAEEITAARLAIWQRYHDALEPLEEEGLVRRPIVPESCRHNGHLYHLRVSDRATRDALIDELRSAGIQAVFHYVPLHSSPAGRRFGRAAGDLPETDRASDRLVRLPLWVGMADRQVDRIADVVGRFLRREGRPAQSLA